MKAFKGEVARRHGGLAKNILQLEAQAVVSTSLQSSRHANFRKDMEKAPSSQRPPDEKTTWPPYIHRPKQKDFRLRNYFEIVRQAKIEKAHQSPTPTTIFKQQKRTSTCTTKQRHLTLKATRTTEQTAKQHVKKIHKDIHPHTAHT